MIVLIPGRRMTSAFHHAIIMDTKATPHAPEKTRGKLMKTYFHDVFPSLLAGKKIRRKGWEGFWAWENDTIVIHHGEEAFDIRKTDNPQFTFGNIAADDWEIVTENV